MAEVGVAGDVDVGSAVVAGPGGIEADEVIAGIVGVGKEPAGIAHRPCVSAAYGFCPPYAKTPVVACIEGATPGVNVIVGAGVVDCVVVGGVLVVVVAVVGVVLLVVAAPEVDAVAAKVVFVVAFPVPVPPRGLTLLFNGGSSAFFVFVPLPPVAGVVSAAEAAALCAFASCSSNVFSYFSSNDQKNPLPRSPPHLSIFLNAFPEDRLCRTELCKQDPDQ